MQFTLISPLTVTKSTVKLNCEFGNLPSLSSRLLQATCCLLTSSDHTVPWSQSWHTHLTFTLLAHGDGQVSSAFSISFFSLSVCVHVCMGVCVGVYTCDTTVHYGKHAVIQTTISFSLHLLSPLYRYILYMSYPMFFLTLLENLRALRVLL